MVKATDILKRQHRLIEQLFGVIERSRKAARRRAVLHELAENLLIHMLLEEEIFYPAARDALPDDTEVTKSVEEHLMARTALHRLISTAVDSDDFVARLAVVKALIVMHVKEEERVFFPRVNARLERDEQIDISERMQSMMVQARKMDIVAQTFGRVRARRGELSLR